ncbi:MAG: class I SAM-dependent rRNA methyltransferase [Myxococcaceae bacterium]|nr:class I SAM-dependent rRNA methyltransferase [Myxococcaceae bacterium]
MNDAALRRALQKAIDRRAPLRQRTPTTNAFRLVNARGDALPDVTVDLFDKVAVLSLYRDLPPDEEVRLAEAVRQTSGARAVYLKRRPREARVAANVAKSEVAPESPITGERVDELTVLENGVHFVIRPGQGLSVGLYLDMRDTRQWVREQIRGRTLLNTFAYTCGFGVYAHHGGAARAVNVDLSRRVLDWGEENLRRNGFLPDRRDHLAGDCFEWLKRLAKKGETFDVVVLDPPSFSTSRSGRFSAARDYPKLAAAAAPVVADGGWLVACCNLQQLSGARFEAMVQAGIAQAGRSARLIQRLGPSAIDFPSTSDEPPGLKVRVYEVRSR